MTLFFEVVFMVVFKEHLRSIRKSKKVTQKEVALAVRVTERNYQDWEYGNTKPGFDALIALADYFGVSLDYLVGRSDDPERR
jgi:transcriptional regulator with XRE-family HTH domain